MRCTTGREHAGHWITIHIGIFQFMTKNPAKRLGCVHNEMDKAILIHPFFHEKINWEALEKREVRPPFRPKIVSLMKVCNA